MLHGKRTSSAGSPLRRIPVDDWASRSLRELIIRSAWRDPRLTLVQRTGLTAEAAPVFLGWLGDRVLGVVFDARSTANRRALHAPADGERQWSFVRDAAGHPRVTAFYLVEWRRYGEYEVFPVHPEASWPFTVQRGEGAFSVRELGDVWERLLFQEARAERHLAGDWQLSPVRFADPAYLIR